VIASPSAPGQGWLVPFADLALILFVITATGLANAVSKQEIEMPDGEVLAQGIGEGVATSVFIDSAGAPPLREWLLRHQLGEGEQLTLLCQYDGATTRRDVVVRCDALAEEAIALGRQPRLIVEEAAQQQVIAYFAHDRDPLLARSLLNSQQI